VTCQSVVSTDHRRIAKCPISCNSLLRLERAGRCWAGAKLSLQSGPLSLNCPHAMGTEGFCHPRLGQEEQLLSESGEVPACYRFSSLAIFIITQPRTEACVCALGNHAGALGEWRVRGLKCQTCTRHATLSAKHCRLGIFGLCSITAAAAMDCLQGQRDDGCEWPSDSRVLVTMPPNS
jgi:hypothetical protein